MHISLRTTVVKIYAFSNPKVLLLIAPLYHAGCIQFQGLRHLGEGFFLAIFSGV